MKNLPKHNSSKRPWFSGNFENFFEPKKIYAAEIPDTLAYINFFLLLIVRHFNEKSGFRIGKFLFSITFYILKVYSNINKWIRMRFFAIIISFQIETWKKSFLSWGNRNLLWPGTNCFVTRIWIDFYVVTHKI